MKKKAWKCMDGEVTTETRETDDERDTGCGSKCILTPFFLPRNTHGYSAIILLF